MDATRLEDLPEAVPLRRVSPAWRVLAVLGLIGIFGLGVVIISLLTWIVHLRDEIDELSSNGPPAPVTTFAVPTKVLEPDPEPDDPVDLARLPYPVVEDLRKTPAGGEKPNGKPSPQSRFLAKSTTVWKAPRSQ